MAQLLGVDIPEGLKCDVKSLCTLSEVPRATLYRSYPHIRPNSNANGRTPRRPGSTRTHE